MCNVRERESGEGNRKQKMDGDEKKKNPAKKGVEKKMKKLVTMVRGGIDRSTLSRML